VVLEILQSANGNELLEKCIEIIKSFYGYIRSPRKKKLKGKLKDVVRATLLHFKFYIKFGSGTRDALSDTNDEDYLVSEVTGKNDNVWKTTKHLQS